MFKWCFFTLMLFCFLDIQVQTDPPPVDGGIRPGDVDDVPLDVVLDDVLVVCAFLGVWIAKFVQEKSIGLKKIDLDDLNPIELPWVC